MNFQCDSPLDPLRVLIINSVSPATKFLAVKILSGEIFGRNQLINLVLMIFSDDQVKTTSLKFELEKCAFACTNSITVSSSYPSITDSDVFCLLTNFDNPNTLDFGNPNTVNKQVAMIDSIINIANNLQGPLQEDYSSVMAKKQEIKTQKPVVPEKKAHKPIIVTDGLVSIHILMYVTKNLPSDILFCPTPIAGIAKSVLGEHLKVPRKVLNNVLVWAANDEICHVEFEKPLIIVGDKVELSPCDRETVSKDVLVSTNLDHTQFSSSWLKKDLIAKSVAIARKNPYGNIYKASSVAKALQQIWSTRLTNEAHYTNMGVVSDGCLETIRGYPYVLPIKFNGETWGVNERFKNDAHLKQEIKKMNKAVKSLNEKVITLCKELLLVCASSSLLSVGEEENQEEHV